MTSFLYISAAGVAGFAVMAFELAVSRMAAPVFGTSLPIWATIISVVLLGGALGYGLGGRLSHRSNPATWAGLGFMASGVVVSVAAVLFPMMLSVGSDAGGQGMLVRGAVLLVLGGAAMAPFVGLGLVMPLLIRAGVTDVSHSGRIAGKLSAAGAVGSLAGTLSSAFFFFGAIGVRGTTLLVAALLLVVGALLLGRRRRMLPVVLPVLVGAAALSTFLSSSKATTFAGKKVIVDTESGEHARILVLEDRMGRRELRLDMGVSVQSVYDPRGPSRYGSWPLFLLAALLRDPCDRAPGSVLVLGTAAGTVARDLSFAYPEARVTGVDADRALLDIGRRYFDVPPKTQLVAGDGRAVMRRLDGAYDLIFLDAYRDIYVPFHLATDAFFREGRSRLAGGGVFAANILFLENEQALLTRIMTTMASVFENVAVLRTPGSMNAILFGWDGRALSEIDPVRCALPEHRGQARRTVARFDDLEPFMADTAAGVLTDDRSDVEYLTHRIAWRALVNSLHGVDR